MQTFEEIQQQITDLQKQADAMRKQAVSAAIKEIKRLIHLYGISALDIGLVASTKTNSTNAKQKNKATPAASPKKISKKSPSDKRSFVVAKYRDSESGQTWTGRGKPPTWLAAKIAAGATKESFRI